METWGGGKLTALVDEIRGNSSIEGSDYQDRFGRT